MRVPTLTDQNALSNPVLAACSEGSRAKLAEWGHIQRFEAEDRLFQAGDAAGVVLLPLSGSLQISKTAERGRRQIMCNLSNQSCGGICLLTMGERSLADVVALTEGEVIALSRADFQIMARSDPMFCQSGWQAAVECMAHFSDLVEHLSFHKVAERVAHVLLVHTDKDGDLVRLTQAELAAEVGTTREVVARCLAGLQAEGALRLGRARITVMNREKLRQETAEAH